MEKETAERTVEKLLTAFLELKGEQNKMLVQFSELSTVVKGDIRAVMEGHGRELTEVAGSLKSLERMLRGSEDRGGMVSRMERLEDRLGLVSTDLRGAMDEFRKAMDVRSIEDTKGKWSVTTTVILIVGSILAAIIGALAAYIKK